MTSANPPITMKNFPIPHPRLPGISSFLKRSPMFKVAPSAPVPKASDLVKAAIEALRNGQYLPGDEFPVPEKISKNTGASLFDSLETVTFLLRAGSIHQDPNGRLLVAANEEYTSSRHSGY